MLTHRINLVGNHFLSALQIILIYYIISLN